MYEARRHQDPGATLARARSNAFLKTALLLALGAVTAAVTGCGTSNDGNGGNPGVGGATGAAGTSGAVGGTVGGTGTGGRAGVAGTPGTAGATGTGGGVGTGGGPGTTPDGGVGPGCSTTTPPAGSTLVGWAAVNPMNPNGTTGGGSAASVTVTTTATFNSNAGGTVARVIYVTGSLSGNFTIGSNKTIVGLCGAQLHGHVEISGSTNVILRNITIVGYGVGNCALDPTFDATVGCSSGYDAVTVVNGAQRIWIDHCDISDGTDGNLDITLGSNFVTVSWTKFHYTKRTDLGGNDSSGASGHRFSNLVGGGDNSPPDVGKLNVTWHHDWWADNVSERQPRVRYGQNHIFNSLYTGTGDDYCVRAGMNAQLLVESNVFTGVASPQQFNSPADQTTSFITANTNLYTATTGSRSTGGGGTPFTTPPYTYVLDDTAALQAAIQAGAGPQ
jgi:pectate lyase